MTSRLESRRVRLHCTTLARLARSGRLRVVEICGKMVNGHVVDAWHTRNGSVSGLVAAWNGGMARRVERGVAGACHGACKTHGKARYG